jgi:tight adherence protein C
MRLNELSILLNKAAKRLLPILPDSLTGSAAIIEQKLKMRHGDKDCNELVYQKKLDLLRKYLLILLIFMICLIALMINAFCSKSDLSVLKRPAYGEMGYSTPAKAYVTYGEYKIDQDIVLKTLPAQLTEAEKRQALLDFKEKLSDMILGENKDPHHISKPLKLLTEDTASGIKILWESEKPEIISSKGEVNLTKAKNGETVYLHAVLSLGEQTEEKIIALEVGKGATRKDYEKNLITILNEKIKQLNQSSGAGDMTLPDTLGDGIKVRWETSDFGDITFLIAACFIAMIIVFMKRYDPLDKELKQIKDSILADLPEFINKLVLLLNAGLVVSSALEKIAKDYEKYQMKMEGTKKNKNTRVLFRELCEMNKRVSQTNTSIMKELKDYSQRSGVRELVRITAMIADNLNKGSALSEKLESEGELLWLSRKKRAEEKGRIVETKLTFPLVILLLVLIMITIAPALNEM